MIRVGIQITDLSGIQMVKTRPIVEWSDNQAMICRTNCWLGPTPNNYGPTKYWTCSYSNPHCIWIVKKVSPIPMLEKVWRTGCLLLLSPVLKWFRNLMSGIRIPTVIKFYQLPGDLRSGFVDCLNVGDWIRRGFYLERPRFINFLNFGPNFVRSSNVFGTRNVESRICRAEDRDQTDFRLVTLTFFPLHLQ